MTARNDVTGDKIQTKTNSEEYRNNFDNIDFGTPLYNIPRETWVETPEGHRFFFDHIDGMYSYCKEVGGGISHYSASMKVYISKDQS